MCDLGIRSWDSIKLIVLFLFRMILKDLETADKTLKKEPEDTPPGSNDPAPPPLHVQVGGRGLWIFVVGGLWVTVCRLSMLVSCMFVGFVA